MLELFAGDVEVGEAGRWAVVALLFVLGAVLGSFMNVVIYRLPRGMSLVRPGSQCPHCEQLIRWHDNIPILGWLLLAGRCRDCGMRISPRYPIVELLVGAYSAALAWVQVAQPLVQLAADAPSLFVLDFGPYVLDMLVVCTLFCAASIELDGLIVPQWLLSFTLVVGITLTTLWPQWQIDAAAGQWLLRGVPESVPGVLAALWLALLAWPAFIGAGGSRGIMNAASAAGELAIVGIYLGLWAAVALGVASMALLVVARLIALAWRPMARAGLAVWLTVVTVPWVVASRPASGYLARWIVEREWPALLSAGALAAVLALIARWLDRSPHAASADRG